MRRKLHPVALSLLLTVVLSACGGSDGPAATPSDDPSGSPTRSGTAGSIADAIAGEVSWTWDPFRDRASAQPDDPELPRAQHAFVVGGEVWIEGVTDPPIGEDSEPVTAVIDPEERSFEVFDTPGFGVVTVHDGVMIGFDRDTRAIVTFTPEEGAGEPVEVREVTTAFGNRIPLSVAVELLSLDDERILLQVGRTVFELDSDSPGSVVSSFSITELFPDLDGSEPVRTSAAGDQILYHFYGDNRIFAAAPRSQPVPIDADDPQAEVLGSPEATVWHKGSSLIAWDPVVGEATEITLPGEPVQRPANAVSWNPSEVTRLGANNNPALHIAGDPTGVVAALAKRDEIVLVDVASGSKAAVGHLFGDVASFRPLVVGDEVWVWRVDGQGIQILTYGPPSTGPDEAEGSGSAPTPGEDVTDDPDYKSGFQQGRADGETDAEGGWDYSNDPDSYDPGATAAFQAGYRAGYDAGYSDAAGDGGSVDGDTGTSAPGDDDCPPGESLLECYG